MEMNKRVCPIRIEEGHTVGVQMLMSFQIYFLKLNSCVQLAMWLLAAASLQLLMMQVARESG